MIYYLEGLIGAGKSTVLRALQQSGHSVFYEPSWTLVDKMYKDPKTYSEIFQVQVIASYAALEDQQFCERSPDTALGIFAKLRWRLKDIRCLDTLHNVYSSFPHKEGLHVYLDVPVETCLERCNARNTPIDPEYMQMLKDEHETYFRGNKKCLKIVLDGTETPEETANLILRTVSCEVV